MVGRFAQMSIRQSALALCHQLLLSGREPLIERKKELEKSGRKVTLWIEVLRRGVDGKAVQLVHAGETVTGRRLLLHPVETQSASVDVSIIAA